MKIKKGDKVMVTAGKDKGRQGVVEKIILKDSKLLVAGVNLFKKHQKPVRGRSGGIIDIARPLPVSSVVIICPKCNQKTRIGYSLTEGKIRICKKCKEII